jgi:hypothetical protein
VALRALRRRPALEIAGVAPQPTAGGVEGEGDAAAWAFQRFAALLAQEERRKASPVEKEERLLAPAEPIGDGIAERRRQETLASMDLPKVHDLNLGKGTSLDALRQPHQGVAAGLCPLKAL